MCRGTIQIIGVVTLCVLRGLFQRKENCFAVCVRWDGMRLGLMLRTVAWVILLSIDVISIVLMDRRDGWTGGREIDGHKHVGL